MSKEDLIKYGLMSVGIVLGARFFANALFAWVERLFVGKSAEEKTLDDLIKSKRFSMGALSEKAAPPTAQQTPKELGQQLDPMEEKKRAIMHRIYDLDIRRGQQESVKAYHLRLLGLSKVETPEQLKKAYKQRAREFHPDTFALVDFEQRTRKRLEARIHENYVAIQRAYEFFSKK